MSAGIEGICREMADYLEHRGMVAVTAWPATPRKAEQAVTVVVSLRGCQVGPAGFQNYLGERYDEASGLWQERYGKSAKLTFGLDLYAPERADGQQLQEAFDTLAGALALGGPESLCVEEFSCGQTAYDPESRRLKRPAQAVCSAYLYVVSRADGQFVDFELRGVMRA